MIRETDFTQPLIPPWKLTEIGNGLVTQAPNLLRLSVPPTPANLYSDAQINDYAGKADFSWRPPVRMTIAARTTGQPQGTAGFGFWNHPFVPGERGFRFPQAVWFFFSSPPNNMQLAKGVPGSGWKAATIDTTRPAFFALLPTAPIGFLLMRVPALYDRLWPIGQRAIGVSEHLLDSALLTDTHTYTLDWREDGVTFLVDGQIVHEAPTAPRGALGFIAWIDNQYAVVTPKGQLGYGLLSVEYEQSLIIEYIRLESRSSS